MSLQRRRVIYMDDETWDRLRERARLQETTISALIRDALVGPGRAKVVETRVAPPISVDL